MKYRLIMVVVLVNIITTLQARETTSGMINFNIGEPPVKIAQRQQPVTLLGCNNKVFKTKIDWGKSNQVVDNIPYGYTSHASEKEYFVGKYYVASPPVNVGGKNKPQYLGLVTPDHYVFQGESPAQIVNLDYKILKPTYLKHVKVDFDYSEAFIHSCKSQGVTSIPINTVCRDFPWKTGAQGASGIGHLKYGNEAKIFLPFVDKNKKRPLQCNVTLLDDVMLNHRVYFLSDKVWKKTLNLTKQYTKAQKLKLVCIPRNPSDIPAGCKAPDF